MRTHHLFRSARGVLMAAAVAAMTMVGCEEEEPVAPAPVGVEQTEAPQVYGLEREQEVAERREQRVEQLPAAEGEMLFPAAGGEGVLRVVREGEDEIRVGQLYEYTIRVTNVSEHPVAGVRVFESLPASFQIDTAQPEPRIRRGGQPGMQMQQRMQGQPQTFGFPQQQQQEQPIQQQQPMQQEIPQQQRGPQAAPPQAPLTGTPPPAPEAAGPQAQPPGAEQRQQLQAQQRQQAQQAQQQQPQQAQRAPMALAQWYLGVLEPGETRVITVQGVAAQAGTLASCIAVQYEPTLCTTVNVVQPDLAMQRVILTSEGEPARIVYACEPIVFHYRLANTGTGPTKAVQVREQLPEWLVTEDGQDTIAFNVDPIAAGDTIERSIVVEPQAAGQYTGRAIATTNGLEARSSQAQVRIVQPELALQVQAAQQEYLNRPLRYQVTVTNTSNVPALRTSVLARIPGNLTNITYEGAEFDEETERFLIGRIDPGESRTLAVIATGVEPGPVNMQFIADGYCVQRAAQEVQTVLRGIPAVRLEVVDLTDPVRVGETTTYEIRVKNQGSAEDLNVRINAQLPQGLEFVNAEGDTQVAVRGNQLRFQPIDVLGPGDMAVWLVETRATNPGPVRFQLQLQSDVNRQQVIEMEPTTIY